jgi:hypothetical protein
MVGWFHLPLALSEAEHHAAQDMVPGSKKDKGRGWGFQYPLQRHASNDLTFFH